VENTTTMGCNARKTNNNNIDTYLKTALGFITLVLDMLINEYSLNGSWIILEITKCRATFKGITAYSLTYM
jgi:hypothetical protein